MSYAAHHKDFASFVSHTATANDDAVAEKAGILRRVFDAFMNSRQRDVDRQIADLQVLRAALIERRDQAETADPSTCSADTVCRYV